MSQLLGHTGSFAHSTPTEDGVGLKVVLSSQSQPCLYNDWTSEHLDNATPLYLLHLCNTSHE